MTSNFFPAEELVGVSVVQCKEECRLCGTVEQVYPGKWVSISCNSTVITSSVTITPPDSKNADALICEIVLFGSKNFKH